jgi:uncharacterized membrane protein YdbT with pleckstrin-like domain
MNREAILKRHSAAIAYWFNYLIAAGIFLSPVWFGSVIPFDLGPLENWVQFGGPLIGLLVFGVTELVRRTETFYIFENGLSREFTFLSSSSLFVDFGNIEELRVSQTIPERVFGIGTIYVETAGEQAGGLEFRNIRNPYEIEIFVRQRMAEYAKGHTRA